MAVTGWMGTGAIITGTYQFGANTRVVVDSFSRTNNTVTANNAYAQMQVTSPNGGVSFSGIAKRIWLEVPRSTLRINDQNLGNGGTTGSIYSSNGGNYSFGVGADQTSIEVNAGAAYGGDGVSWGGGAFLSIPAAGSPSGQSASASNVSVTTAQLNASISNWGENCTAGTGQRIEYKKTTDGSWTTLAYSTSSSHNRQVTGLTPGTQYQVRTYAQNGAGKGGNSSTITFTTLPAPNISAALLSIVGVK